MPHKDPEAKRAYQRIYARKRRITHRAATLASAARSRKAHAEEIRCRLKKWRDTHVEKRKAEQAAYYLRHQEKIKAIERARHLANRAKNNARRAAHAKANPEQARAGNRRHSALKRGASICDFTAAQWREMQAVYDHRCAYCGKRAKGHLTQDHITPLSKGGAHTLANIVPACNTCNISKGVRPPKVPVQPLLLTIAPAKGIKHR